jgi:hypothetical protein
VCFSIKIVIAATLQWASRVRFSIAQAQGSRSSDVQLFAGGGAFWDEFRPTPCKFGEVPYDFTLHFLLVYHHLVRICWMVRKERMEVLQTRDATLQKDFVLDCCLFEWELELESPYTLEGVGKHYA